MIMVAASLSLIGLLQITIGGDVLYGDPADKKLQIQFDRFHSKFTWIYSVNMVLGLSLLYIHGKEMARFRDDQPEPDKQVLSTN